MKKLTALFLGLILMLNFVALAGVALALTLYSGIGYIVEGVRLMRGGPVGHSDEGDGGDSSSSGSPLAGQHVQA